MVTNKKKTIIKIIIGVFLIILIILLTAIITKSIILRKLENGNNNKQNEININENNTNDVNTNNESEVVSNNSNDNNNSNNNKQDVNDKKDNDEIISLINGVYVGNVKATDKEIYGYIHIKISKSICENKYPIDECDMFNTDSKYSEINKEQFNTLEDLFNMTYDDLLQMENDLYNETKSNKKDNITIKIFFLNENTIKYEYNPSMEYWLSKQEYTGIYHMTQNNKYTYNLNGCFENYANGTIIVGNNYICLNDNSCSNKFYKQ